ncbi:TonB-dependent receptor [Peristeroidobacter soli]|uniref:TonB-dependent receptor n=1 Tax=Peristeroidobacter soli TaxID=2497877 RepID=UPI00158F0D20|nr:TonB-dependent receptor [Peristeroidobacter soli]
MQTAHVVAAACLTMSSVALAEQTSVNGTPRHEESESLLQEIIVTASRREERLRDTPSAITAITGANLETMGVQSFRDYASLVPGLSQRDTGAPGLGTIILRGMNTGGQQTTNTTAYYVDDTVFTASGFLSQGALVTPEPELAEIDRIEVLKGPQGTLYGASSLGGLIRIVTKKPDASEAYGNVRTEFTTMSGGEEGYMIRGSLNAPIVRDKLAIQAAGYKRSLPGFADNVATGTEDANSSDLYGGRVVVRATPTDDLTIDVSGLIQNIENDGYSYESLVPGTQRPLYGDYKYDHYRNFGSSLKYRLANATLTWAGLDAGSLIASASYAEYDVNTRSDATSTYVPVAQARAPVVLGTAIPANTGALANPSPSMDKFTADVRFVSNRMGPVEFMGGVFYTQEDSVYDIDILLQDRATGANLPSPLDLLYHTQTTSDYEELAGYGNLTYFITDRLDIQGGIRYARNEQRASIRGPNALYAYVSLPKLEFPFEDSQSTYLATVRWRPSDSISTYLRAASGYRPGGPQTNSNPPPGAPLLIDPDTVWNYEAGVKGTFLDGALSTNFSVYHIDWKKIQLNALDASGVLLQTNGGDAEVDGVELELIAQPISGLTLTANAGYTDARIVSVLPGVSTATGARVGDNLPLTPEYTVAFTADQRISLTNDMTGLLGATLRYQSDMPNNYAASTTAAQRTLASITTVDLRGGVEFDRYTIQLRAQNLLNEHAYLSVANNVATVIQPRSITLAFSAGF